MNIIGLKEDIILLRDGNKIKIDVRSNRYDMNTFKDDVFTKLIYLGYLAYDEDTKEVYIPNKEILYGFNTIIRGSLWNTVAKKIELSRQLLKVV